jgi:molybdopterin-guanine dinucleotide biosynthesis adapter protein
MAPRGRRAVIGRARAGRGRPPGSRRDPPILAVSGPSGAGKTRLLSRLIPALARRGVRVAVIKHTGHPHPFDRPGKDTDVVRRSGAIAAAIEGPGGMALFGPPAGSARALARFLPPADVILAEGWRGEPLPRIEVHRRRISREFLCASDRGVLAVVTDEPVPMALPAFAPEDIEAVADLVCRWLLAGATARPGPAVRAPRVSRRR